MSRNCDENHKLYQVIQFMLAKQFMPEFCRKKMDAFRLKWYYWMSYTKSKVFRFGIEFEFTLLIII